MKLNAAILKIRKEYIRAVLDEIHTPGEPAKLFDEWLDAAIDSALPEPNAMNLSTVNENKRPSSRIVLLRGVLPEGFVFFSNYHSRKGKEIETNPFGSLNFFWPELERQVRIEGRISRTSAEISDEYFAQRPRGSQIGAWTSPQSSKIESRAVLEEREKKIEKTFESKDIIRPEDWGGYMLHPDYFEFWQGRENRLHDRICYQLNQGIWNKFRIAP